MVARLIEGFESSTNGADYTGKWTSISGTHAIVPSAGRFGNGLDALSTAIILNRTFDAQATWIVGFAFRAASFSTANELVNLVDTSVIHCGVGLNAAGFLVAWRGTVTTVLGTASVPLATNVWHYIECKFTINDTTGVAIVRLNGVPVINLTSQDTRNAGNATANIVRFTLTGGTSGHDIDDIYICDGSGSVNNDFLGDCKVEQVLPTGAGATTAWTPSAGSNWDAVNDSPAPDGDTTYVSSATAGQTDTYAFGDLSVAAASTVKCVQATVLARKDDAGSRSLAVVARPGSTDRVGATQAVGDSYAAYTEVWNTNPDTAAAWTVAEVNAGQFGVRLIA